MTRDFLDSPRIPAQPERKVDATIAIDRPSHHGRGAAWVASVGWVRALRIALVSFATAITLLGCASAPRPEPGDARFRTVAPATDAALASPEGLAEFESEDADLYVLGAGDVVRIDVFGRPEVSGRQVIGPDGRITLPIVGDLPIGELTRTEALDKVRSAFESLYANPVVTLAIEDYVSNQVTVLGRVERAGVQRFAKPPTLAEVLANAGAMPILDKQATLTRCAIFRGRDQLIWVDLKALLNGDLRYNLTMRKGDIVFIPDSSDTSVFVLGSVVKPGSYRLTPGMSVLDAFAQAGGPNEDAHPRRIALYRPGADSIQEIDIDEVIGTARLGNYALEDGDVIYVPRRGLANLGYVLRQIAPAVSVLSFGATLKAIDNGE